MSGKSRQKHSRDTGSTKSVVSAVLAEGALAEMVFVPEKRQTEFIVWHDGHWHRAASVTERDGNNFVPYAANNSLLTTGAVLFPSDVEEYGSTVELLSDLRDYIHRFVDVDPGFELLAAHYVLLTWLFDCFHELPYLRLCGDYGTGKTRFLQVVGSVCYRPIFASGASTISPIFHLLDAVGGTLIIDEADFRVSDETSEMTKILNNGNATGMPLLRAEKSNAHEFNPRVFNVYGPKMLAMRGRFDDRGLESRFLTKTMSSQPIRDDIPLSYSNTQRDAARELRNKLLMYRFRNWGRVVPADTRCLQSLEPRTRQLLAPLLALAPDAKTREELVRVSTACAVHRNVTSGPMPSIEI